jgi:hypothetical protein
MQLPSFFLFFLLFVSAFVTTDPGEFKERRQRTSKAFSDGILLLHSKTATSDTEDGYREEAPFYYLTGLENSPSAILAIVGKSGDSWLFLNTNLSGDVQPGAEAERKLDIQHVVDWGELDGFLTRQIATGTVIYFERGPAMLPENLSAAKEGRMPTWVQVLQKRWPTAEFRPIDRKLNTLMAVESSSEQQALSSGAWR